MHIWISGGSLNASQRKLVYRHWNGPVRVLGGAGTGKTVVAMHRAAYLAEKLYTEPSERILFTTFTKNLAIDIRNNLAKLCSPEALFGSMWRIWISGFRIYCTRLGTNMRSTGASNDLKRLDQAEALGAECNKPAGFFRDEWELVVQPQGWRPGKIIKAQKEPGVVFG